MAKHQAVLCLFTMVDVSDPDTGLVRTVPAMVPVQRDRRQAERQWQLEEEYPIIVSEGRSAVTHRHYFASVAEGYGNLPETIAARWPSSEHMRKWMLIETGWFDEKEWTFDGRGAEQQARRLGAFIRTEDEYARITVTLVEGEAADREKALDRAVEEWGKHPDATLRERLRLTIRAALAALDKGGKWKVIVRRARSQDHASMNAAEFQKSKSDVLDLLSSMIGTSRKDLEKNAGRSA